MGTGKGDQRFKAQHWLQTTFRCPGKRTDMMNVKSRSFTQVGACSIKGNSSWIWYALRAHCGTLGNLGSKWGARRGQQTAALLCVTGTNTGAEWKNKTVRAAAIFWASCSHSQPPAPGSLPRRSRRPKSGISHCLSFLLLSAPSRHCLSGPFNHQEGF